MHPSVFYHCFSCTQGGAGASGAWSCGLGAKAGLHLWTSRQFIARTVRGKWRTQTHSKRPTGKTLEPSSLLLCGDGVNRCTTVSAFPPILIPLYKSFPSPFLCLHTNKDCHCSADQWKHNRDLLSCSRADLLTVLGVGGWRWGVAMCHL